MPGLTETYPQGQGVMGQGHVKDDEEGEAAKKSQTQRCLNQMTALGHVLQTSWCQAVRTLRYWRGWYSFAPAGVVWSVCQVEAPLHPNVRLLDVYWRLLMVWWPWVVLGVCVYGLKCCLRPGQRQGEPSQPSTQREVITENKKDPYSWTSQLSVPACVDPLALVLADTLLLCVLQEPLSEPSVTHIRTLLSRLESVCQSLEKAEVGAELPREEVERRSALTDKVKLIITYLQKRTAALSSLVQVQGGFEASVGGMQEGLEGLWARLEGLHTGVTLSKQAGRGHTDLESAQTDAQTLFSVLEDYKKRFQSCQDHLQESTQLLQELTWSHSHITSSVRGQSESAWPELLLQSNIEQFDNVQQSFLSLEQQTSTFQAHLEGLGQDVHKGHTGLSPQPSLRLHNGRPSDASLEGRNSPSEASTSVPTSVPSAHTHTDTDKEAKKDSRLSLFEKSARPFFNIGRLRISGKKK